MRKRRVHQHFIVAKIGSYASRAACGVEVTKSYGVNTWRGAVGVDKCPGCLGVKEESNESENRDRAEARA